MITLISGTNRTASRSRAIVDLYATLLEAKGEPYQILDLTELPDDFIVSAMYANCGQNEQFNRLTELITSGDKFVFVVPEYNSSFPGVLKAFIDALSYPCPFQNKKGALIGLSSGMQGSGLALSHLTDILNYLGMHIMATKLKLAHIEQNFDGKLITNELYNELLEQHVAQLIQF
ncbi:NAD(P)H-dependent oxidoreductase [Pontibacter sp. E15-1]|uniref:NADPH-dependent FMN reductase n=1 Tax=Pontibacter sp. E15-1 TaxID=2919918 RepID=UPI001F4F2432|nr:NAD(P)H-dependent oxidoreductase [Pontibacter sp. E15-1]MCJ8164948.1 NAD(P)H-dependent oxidoreductase [Pontibacter sp. E15-1]